MVVTEAFDLISRAIDTGRAANGYLVCGDLKGGCAELTERILLKLFPDGREQVLAKTHPDVVILEPEGKKRIITVDSMRDRVVAPMSETSYSGGWKVGIITSAERMEAPSANAFLKSLEEPTPKTLYLLLTDAPDAILPTIVSRTQRIDLPLSDGVLEGEDADEIADALAARDAKRLAAKIAALKDDADDADVAIVRKAFYKTLMSYMRKLMIADRIPRYLAFRNITAVEDAYRQSEKSINDDAVLSFMVDRLTLK